MIALLSHRSFTSHDTCSRRGQRACGTAHRRNPPAPSPVTTRSVRPAEKPAAGPGHPPLPGGTRTGPPGPAVPPPRSRPRGKAAPPPHGPARSPAGRSGRPPPFSARGGGQPPPPYRRCGPRRGR